MLFLVIWLIYDLCLSHLELSFSKQPSHQICMHCCGMAFSNWSGYAFNALYTHVYIWVSSYQLQSALYPMQTTVMPSIFADVNGCAMVAPNMANTTQQFAVTLPRRKYLSILCVVLSSPSRHCGLVTSIIHSSLLLPKILQLFRHTYIVQSRNKMLLNAINK